MALAGVGAVLSGLGGYYTTFRNVEKIVEPISSSTAAVTATTAATALVAPLSILVLPFANQTGDPAKAYIADALTTSITADLSRIRDASVVPVATAFTYKTKSLTVQQAAKDAAVRFVLDGSVMASGDKLRITAQLVDTTSAKQLWTDTFDGPLGDLFALQDQVTARIGNTIGEHIVVVAAKDIEKRKGSPTVADSMMRARAISLLPETVENSLEVESIYRTVLVQEPGNLAAKVRLAAKLALRAANWLEDSNPEKDKLMTEARNLALEVRASDATIALVNQPLALYAGYHRDYEGARHAWEQWAESDPKNPRVYRCLGAFYMVVGEPGRALPVFKRGLALYPKESGMMYESIGSAYLELGDNDSAIEWLLKSLDANEPDRDIHSNLAIAYSNKGDKKNAALHAAAYRQIAEVHGYKGIAERPLPAGTPAARLRYYNEHYVPEWKKAGLP
jgi:adenylate cyclase